MNLAVLATAMGLLVPGPSVAVDIQAHGCAQGEPLVSCTWAGGPILWAPPYDRASLIHEIGHQFDYYQMTDADRAEFEAINGDPRPWRAAGGNSPHEQFAEAYRMCAMHKRWPSSYSVNYGLRLGPKRFRAACSIIRRAGA